MWKPAAGPLSTRWSKDVSPERVHPEYPRPQLVRDDWLNLNGLWQLQLAEDLSAAPAGELPDRILVPFPVESALSGVMKRTRYAWYRRRFEIPPGWKPGRVLLHFGAVDWEARVLVNGKVVGSHRGGYDPFSFDVTDALKPRGQQDLLVGVDDPSDAGSQPRGKQVNNPRGIYYTPTTGIWQTVWLEPVPEVSIAALDLRPDLDRRQLRLAARLRGPGSLERVTLRAEALEGRRVVARAENGDAAGLAITLPSVRPWSPETPYLYGLRVAAVRDGKTLDTVESYFGMRKVGLDGQGASRRMVFNGAPVFQMGLLDQGFWPDGLYAAPTDAALRSDIEAAKRLGFNTLRKHVKVEPQRWYYWADRLGVYVWQDMPSGDNKTAESRAQFQVELDRLVENCRNHPSIVMWVVFNEGWGQFDTERLTRHVKELDPDRLVSNASGWTDRQVGDILDVHHYPDPAPPAATPSWADRAGVIGEFGGLGLGVDGHTWVGKTWGYQAVAGTEQLTTRYEQMLRRIARYREQPGISGAIYTQLTDVETEINGLLTYDRAVTKVDADRVVAANRGSVPDVRQVVKSAQEDVVPWRYATEKPPADWFGRGFRDDGWKQGPAGFGTPQTPGAVVRTRWDSPEIWLRRSFTLPEVPPGELRLWLHHDEDAEVYLNGVLAAAVTGYTTDYEETPLNSQARAALRRGENVIAVHCRQTGGGQYIDVGLCSRVPASRPRNDAGKPAGGKR